MIGIRIFSPRTCDGKKNNFIVNVVYHELLDQATVQPFPQIYDPNANDFNCEDEEEAVNPCD